jgi:hypothetical protein
MRTPRRRSRARGKMCTRDAMVHFACTRANGLSSRYKSPESQYDGSGPLPTFSPFGVQHNDRIGGKVFYDRKMALCEMHVDANAFIRRTR